MSLPARRRRARRTTPLLALPLAAVALAGMSSSALAATTWSGSDPSGDAVGGQKPLDLTAATATYDDAAGSVSVVVTTAAANDSTNNALTIRFGHLVNGVCAPQDADGNSQDPGPLLGVTDAIVTSPAKFELVAWGIDGTSSSGQGTATRSGTKTTITVDPTGDLKGLAFDCVRVSTTALAEDANPTTADELTLLPGGSGGGAGGGGSSSGGGGTSPVVVTTDGPDADKDGIADAADRCPKVAGADNDGCPTVATKNQFKLGAKRVVFDRLTARGAKVCPAKAAAIVTAKGKRLGKSVVAVETHGAYCYVKGVVKLKKRATKVRLVVKATGMTSIAKTLKR